MTPAPRGVPASAGLLLLSLAACAGPSGEADDMCRAERLPDPVDAGAWTIGARLPGDAGDVHAEIRWPDTQEDAAAWPIALVIHGAWGSAGTPVDRSTMRVDPAAGIVSVHLDLPGNARTEGDNDRRGAASRAAVATALGWAAGEVRDLGGCTLADRVPQADRDRLFVVGSSNGGNLAIATLADTSLPVPPVAGLVTWETPAGPQFANVELGADPSVYTPGSCTFGEAVGIVCDMPGERLVVEPTDGVSTLCFDLDEDLACGAPDVTIRGVEDPLTGAVMLSPPLLHLTAQRGLALEGYADEDTALAWWAERDGARLAAALVAARPELPILLLATESDHVQTLADHPHVFGLGEALQRAGAAWTRLNPGADWLLGLEQENVPNAPLRLSDPRGALVPESVEEPTSAMLAAAVLELDERHQYGDW